MNLRLESQDFLHYNGESLCQALLIRINTKWCWLSEVIKQYCYTVMGVSSISLARLLRLPAQYHTTFVKTIMHKCTVSGFGQINKLNWIKELTVRTVWTVKSISPSKNKREKNMPRSTNLRSVSSRRSRAREPKREPGRACSQASTDHQHSTWFLTVISLSDAYRTSNRHMTIFSSTRVSRSLSQLLLSAADRLFDRFVLPWTVGF